MALELLKAKPRQLKKIFEVSFKNKRPLLIVGPPGVGKTEISQSVTKNLGYDLITMYPAISEPVDFRGMPVYDTEGKVAFFVPFDDLKKIINATKTTVVLVDDFGQANLSVQAAAMHMFRARQIGEFKISEHVTFVICTNDKTHHAGVSGVIEPVKSRMYSIVHLEEDLDDWVLWAIENGIRPEVIAFNRFKKDGKMLSNFEPTMDLINTPSPRGNESVSEILDDDYDDYDIEMILIQGAVGRGYAVEFMGFRKMFANLSDPRMIVKDPDSVLIPPGQFDVMWAYCIAIATMAKPEHMDNIVRFAERLPFEFQYKLLQYDCKAADPENHSTSAYTNWAIKNQDKMKHAA